MESEADIGFLESLEFELNRNVVGAESIADGSHATASPSSLSV
jgi:hypothetical protein